MCGVCVYACISKAMDSQPQRLLNSPAAYQGCISQIVFQTVSLQQATKVQIKCFFFLERDALNNESDVRKKKILGKRRVGRVGGRGEGNARVT